MKIYTCDPNGNIAGIDELRRYGVGVMMSPDHHHKPKKSHQQHLFLALDNGAYSCYVHGYSFDEYLFLKWLSWCRKYNLVLDFVVCPDIVGGGKHSLEFSLYWAKRLTSNNLALVVNDDLKFGDIEPHIDKFAWIFVSGGFSRNWLSWVNFAHNNEKRCHIGRCGTIDKIEYAMEIGADSIDSSSLYRNKNLSLLNIAGQPKKQMVMEW